MVDALHEVHRVLRPGGLLIDARPDSRKLALVEHQGRARRRVAGTINTSRETLGDDRASDRAVARVKRDRLFRSRGAGGFMHRVGFASQAELQRYLDDHLRLVRRARWSVDPATRRRWRDDGFTVTRPIRYELLERSSAER